MNKIGVGVGPKAEHKHPFRPLLISFSTTFEFWGYGVSVLYSISLIWIWFAIVALLFRLIWQVIILR